MKLNILSRFLILVITVFLLIGCSSKQVGDESLAKFASAYQIEWNDLSKKYYLVSLSMRNIDSLSANMNLGFTTKNSLGL